MKNADWPEDDYEEQKQVEDKLGQTEIFLTFKSSKHLSDINKMLPLQEPEALQPDNTCHKHKKKKNGEILERSSESNCCNGNFH